MNADDSLTPCRCGCALAAWSMPWPVRPHPAAPWAPVVVHDQAPPARAEAPSPHRTADPDPVDTDLIEPETS